MAGRAPAGWAAQAERCASSVPACFRDDPSVVHVFLNGARTFWGVEKLKPETLKWGETGETVVNACVERLPPRLSDDDVGVTQEQWDRRAPPRRSPAARFPPVAARLPAGGVRAGPMHSWPRACAVRGGAGAHLGPQLCTHARSAHAVARSAPGTPAPQALLCFAARRLTRARTLLPQLHRGPERHV